MAYKEWTINTERYKGYQGVLWYEWADTYNEARDAAAANHGYNPGNLVGTAIGQYDIYNPPHWGHIYFVYRGTLTFDTDKAYLPGGAPVEYAAILLKRYSATAIVIPFDVVVQNGMPSYPEVPVVIGDYDRTKYSGDGGSINADDLVLSSYTPLVLNGTGRSWMNLGGLTKFMLRSSRDIAGIAPVQSSDEERVSFTSNNGTAFDPRLVIRITLSIPTVVTNDATGVLTDRGRFNGERTNSGYWFDSSGFEWKEGVGGAVNSITTGGSGYTTGVFNYLKTGLSSATTYYFRAWSVNDAGKGYGVWKEFTTPGVTTEAVSDVGIDHAKGNGTAAGANITERGFEVKLSFSGTLYQYIEHSIAGFSSGGVSLVGTTWVGTIVKTITETGTFAAESFIDDLGRFPIAVFSDKLFASETYNYRAYAIIDGTTYYGDWVEFTTNSYPSGQGPDDQIVIYDTIPSITGEEELPSVELPEFGLPDFEYPDIPPYNGSWIGMFYYRKAFTKKDLDELRKKCIRFQDNSVEYALVLNHNSRVLQQFLNDMTDYTGADEHNTFRPMIPTEHLNELARKPLNIMGFKRIINSFISNSIDNTHNVNNNFHLIRDGLSDFTYTEDEGFIDITVTTKIVADNNPDAERLKKVIDRLNGEMANSYMLINHNLHVLRAILI